MFGDTAKKRARFASFNNAVNKARQINFCNENGVKTRLRIPVNTGCSTLRCFAGEFTLTLGEPQIKGLDVLSRIDVRMDGACSHLDASLTLTVAKYHCLEIPACHHEDSGEGSRNIVSFVFGDPVLKNMDGFPLFAVPFDTIEVSITSNVRPVVVYFLGRYLNDDSRQVFSAGQMSLVYSYTKEVEVVSTTGDTINISQCIEPDEFPCGGVSLKFPSDQQSPLIDEIVVWANGIDTNVLLAGHDCVLEGSSWTLCQELLPATLHVLASDIKLQLIPPLVHDLRVLVIFQCRRLFLFKDGLFYGFNPTASLVSFK